MAPLYRQRPAGQGSKVSCPQTDFVQCGVGPHLRLTRGRACSLAQHTRWDLNASTTTAKWDGGVTPLGFAISRAAKPPAFAEAGVFEAIVEFLLDQDVITIDAVCATHAEVRYYSPLNIFTPLGLAISIGSAPIVKLLLDRFASPNKPCFNNGTARACLVHPNCVHVAPRSLDAARVRHFQGARGLCRDAHRSQRGGGRQVEQRHVDCVRIRRHDGQ